MKSVIRQTFYRPKLSLTSLLPILERLGLESVFAWSLSKISSNSGAVIRVDRDLDRAVLDIGLVGNDLDLVTLQAFIGTSGASIATAYDRSGKSNHAVQTIKSLQPRIAENGVINSSNGKPTLNLIGTSIQNNSNCMQLALPSGMFAGTTSGAMLCIFRQTAGNGSGTVRIGSATTNNHLSWVDQNAYVSYLSSSRYVFPGYNQSPQLTTHMTINSGTQLTLYKNSRTVLCSTQPTNDFTDNPANHKIVAFEGSVNVSEVILLKSAPTEAQRIALMNDRALYYNILF